MAANLKGQSWAVLAMSEMGKGVWLKQQLDAMRPSHLVIWDTNDEYDKQAQRVDTLSGLLTAISRNTTFALRYVPRGRTDKALRAEFESWCTLVYNSPPGTVIIVEELAEAPRVSRRPVGLSQAVTA